MLLSRLTSTPDLGLMYSACLLPNRFLDHSNPVRAEVGDKRAQNTPLIFVGHTAQTIEEFIRYPGFDRLIDYMVGNSIVVFC